MSDTPETDSALQGVWYKGDHGSAIPALCRRLERERDAKKLEADKYIQLFERATKELEAIKFGKDQP